MKAKRWIEPAVAEYAKSVTSFFLSHRMGEGRGEGGISSLLLMENRSYAFDLVADDGIHAASQ